MAQVITTLKKKGDISVDIYPNIKADNIPNNAVDENKIADNSVTTNKIVDASITTNKIVDEAVTDDKILNVDGSKITNASINGTKLEDDTITANKMFSDDFMKYLVSVNVFTDSLIYGCDEISIKAICLSYTNTFSSISDLPSYWYKFLVGGYVSIENDGVYPIVNVNYNGSTYTLFYLKNGSILNISNVVIDDEEFEFNEISSMSIF